MNKIAYTVTDGGLAAVINGTAYAVARDNPVYGQVRNAIERNASEQTIADLFQTAEAVKRFTRDKVEVKDGCLFFGGEEVHNLVVDRIFEFMTKGLPADPLIKFLGRLLANPSKRSIDELYKFMRNKDLPVTEDGCLLAYKGVREDYTDQYSGKFSNKPGVTNSMPRQKVDDNFLNGCSYGFHVGSLDYATGFGPKTVIVKVDPADVVSVPDDCECQKMRVASYTVLCDYQGPLRRALYTEPYEEEKVWDVESY